MKFSICSTNTAFPSVSYPTSSPVRPRFDSAVPSHVASSSVFMVEIGITNSVNVIVSPLMLSVTEWTVIEPASAVSLHVVEWS